MLFIGQAANYRGGDIVRHLFASGSKRDSLRLREYLAKRYTPNEAAFEQNTTTNRHERDTPTSETISNHLTISDVYLYHNGRSALAAALKATIPKGSGVLVNGFTCHAVAEAIRAAGCTPVYTDIQPDTLHFNVENLKKALERHSTPKKSPQSSTSKTSAPDTSTPSASTPNAAPIRALIVQNTLGIPIDIAPVEDFAKQHNLIIIEDLAHCAGRTYPDGREVGTVGTATALSFGKGKSVDTISGGALILRDRQSIETQPKRPANAPKLSDRLRDRWYPLFGRLIRTLYYIRLNKVFTGILLKLRWISRSADADLSTSVHLPHWQAKLALRQLQILGNNPQHDAPLRTFAFVKNRDHVLTKLEKNGYKFDEFWYEVPVSPVRYYQNQHFPEKDCPMSVWVAQHIINFPSFYPEEKLKTAHQIAKSAKIKPEVI